MNRYKVQSGGMDRVVEAESIDDAAVRAVAEENASEDPQSLGLIMEIIQVVGDSYYLQTERACRKAGCWWDA